MKFMFCRACGDLVQLVSGRVKECSCGNCRGKYADDKFNIEVRFKDPGNARIVGISNGFMSEQDKVEKDLEHPSYAGTMFQIRKSFIIIVPPFSTMDCRLLEE